MTPGSVEAVLVSLIVQDNAEQYTELVLIDEQLHLLDHLRKHLVFHQGNVGAALLGVLITAVDNSIHDELFLIDQLNQVLNILVCHQDNEGTAHVVVGLPCTVKYLLLSTMNKSEEVKYNTGIL